MRHMIQEDGTEADQQNPLEPGFDNGSEMEQFDDLTSAVRELATADVVAFCELAVRCLDPGGVLVTCSCTGRVTREMFLEVLAQVEATTARPARRTSQTAPARSIQ